MSEWSDKLRQGFRSVGGASVTAMDERELEPGADARHFRVGMKLELDAGPSVQRLHVVRFGAESGFRLLAVQGRGERSRVSTLSRMLEENAQRLQGMKPVGAVNGGFFVFTERIGTRGARFRPEATRVGDSLGLMVGHGQMMQWPCFNRAALCRLEDGTVLVRRFSMNDLEFRLNGKPIKFTPDLTEPDKAARFGPDHSEPVTPKSPLRVDSVWINGEEVDRRPGGGTPLPVNGCVFSIPRSMLESDAVEIEAEPPRVGDRKVTDAVTAGPILVDRGRPVTVTEEYLAAQGFGPGLAPMPGLNSILKHYDRPAPRLAAGTTAAGDTVFILVEGRLPGESEGVTLTQLARIAKGAGLEEAVNLDGGASAEILLGSEPVNTPQLGGRKLALELLLALANRFATPGTLPSPRELGAGAERAIGNALLWFLPDRSTA